MNILTIIVLIIFFLFIYMGYKRGLFKSVFRLLVSLIAMILAYWLTPYVGDFLYEKTNINTIVTDKVYSVIEDVVEKNVTESLAQTGQAANRELVDELAGIALQTEPHKSEQIDIINNLSLPDFMTEAIISNNNDEMRVRLGAENFFAYLARYISYMIINAIAFVLTFLMAYIIVNIIYIAIGIVSRLPIIGGIDRMGGVVFGAVQALLIVWILFVISSIFVNTSFGSDINNQIENSAVLSFLNDKNILNSALTKLIK